MNEFFSKIKNKLFPQPDLDFEDDQSPEGSEIIDDVEIETQDSSAIEKAKKKNLVMVIVALVLSVVVYFIIFSEEEKPRDDMVQPVSFDRGITKSEESPFEIEVPKEKPDEDLAVLDKPAVPELPKMPEIEESGAEKKLFDENIFEEDAVEEKKKIDVSKEEESFDQDDGENREEVRKKKEEKKEARRDDSEPSDKEIKDPRYAPIIVLKGASGENFPGAGQEDNLKILNNDAISELADTDAGVQPLFVKDRQNVVGQGKIISAVLETAIDTEVQGSVRAIVSRDVYGEVGDRILISKGSRLYGSYSTNTAKGNSRININWTRLLRPDGVSVAINSIASDQFGRAGIRGTIDNKFGETVSNTLLSSALAIAGVAATDALTNTQTSTTTTDPNNGTSTITQSAVNQAVSEIARNITDSATNAVSGYFDTTPRITVPQGTRITILVNADIKIPTFKEN